MLLKNIYQNNKLIFIHNNKEIIFMNKYNIPIYVMFHHSLCHHDRMIKYDLIQLIFTESKKINVILLYFNKNIQRIVLKKKKII